MSPSVKNEHELAAEPYFAPPQGPDQRCWPEEFSHEKMAIVKVLLVCVHFHGSFGWSIGQALKRQGHDVRIFDYRNPPAPFRFRMRRLWSERWMPYQMIAAARDYRPDLVLIGKGETVPREALQAIRSGQNCRIINWFPDARLFGYEKVADHLSILDFCFSKSVSDVNLSHLMGLNNVKFLQHCADRELQLELKTTEDDLRPYRCEVSMVGTFYPYRERILQRLTDFDIRIWGPGWERGSIFRSKPKAIMGRDARSIEQTCVFRASAINVNTHHYDDASQLNQRVFDIAGSGGCLVSDAYRDYGPIFETPADLMTYRSPDELLEIVRYLLDMPQVRREMADRCMRKMAAHTYDDRVAEIIAMVETG